jgi:hypothetical protein
MWIDSLLLYYSWQAECSEDDLVERLERLRGRILDLGVHKVSEVIRVDPVCNTTVIELGGERGIPISSAVHAAMERETPAGRAHGEWCAVLDSIGFYTHRNWSKSAQTLFH